jgi:hypothetical protein
MLRANQIRLKLEDDGRGVPGYLLFSVLLFERANELFAFSLISILTVFASELVIKEESHS